jgi:tetratricopeptide (TPR) repeat protein
MDAEAGRFAAARARVEARLQATSEPTAELLLLASKVYVANRQLDKAEAMLRRIIDLDSSNLEAFNLLGRYLVVRGKLPEARRQFEELVKKDPRSVSAQTMLGLLAKAQGDTAAAKKAYEAAIRVDPQTPTAANNLAWLYANTDGGNLDLALQLAQTAHAKIPASAQITDTLAFVYYKKEMGSFAVPLLAEALDQEPNNPEYHYHLGLVYAQAGEDAKARKSLQAALKINPQFSGADHARRIISTLVY